MATLARWQSCASRHTGDEEVETEKLKRSSHLSDVLLFHLEPSFVVSSVGSLGPAVLFFLSLTDDAHCCGCACCYLMVVCVCVCVYWCRFVSVLCQAQLQSSSFFPHIWESKAVFWIIVFSLKTAFSLTSCCLKSLWTVWKAKQPKEKFLHKLMEVYGIGSFEPDPSFHLHWSSLCLITGHRWLMPNRSSFKFQGTANFSLNHHYYFCPMLISQVLSPHVPSDLHFSLRFFLLDLFWLFSFLTLLKPEISNNSLCYQCL